MQEATASETGLQSMDGDVLTAMVSHMYSAMQVAAPEQLVQLYVGTGRLNCRHMSGECIFGMVG